MKEEKDKECCGKCFIPERDGDYILPSGHSVVVAYPESCRDEFCECHTPPITNGEEKDI